MNTVGTWTSQSVESFAARWNAVNLPRERGAIARRILSAHPMLDCYQPGDVADVIVEAAHAEGVTGATVDLVLAEMPIGVAIDWLCDRVYEKESVR